MAEVITLGELAHVVHGWPFKSLHYSSKLDEPVVVAIGNFDYSGGFEFETSTVKHYSGEYPAAYELMPDDLLMVMTCQTEGGEILGVPAMVPNDGRTYLHNQRIGKVVIDAPDLLHREYLYHWARTAEFNSQLVTTASGSKILHTSPGRIESARLRLPSLPEQQAIAEVLGALDDKIAANTRLAAVADQYLAALFESKMSRSSESRLDAIADVNVVAVKPKVAGPLRYVDIASVAVGSFNFPEVTDWVDAPGRARRGLNRGDTVWSTVRPNRRSHALNLSSDPLLVASTGLAVLSPRAVGFAYLYEVSKRPEFTTYLENVAEGSAYPAVRADKFAAAPIPLLPAAQVTAFEVVAAPIREAIFAAAEENRTLAATRDALLPKLMSDQLRVRDAEKIVEAAGV